jgi:hypothetical protein
VARFAEARDGKYGEPVLHHTNGLPADVRQRRFGRHTISTHEHNGHHGRRTTFTGAFFFEPVLRLPLADRVGITA